jgi:phosphohistidine phosphatase
MKTLLIVRHAKSSWDNASVSDVDRPLNDRGRHDAPIMAQRLIKAGAHIDLFVSSPAKRARQTAESFLREYRKKEAAIQFIPELYHAPVNVFKDVIAGLDEKADSVAIFSHNPGITAFVNTLTSVYVDNMPTCAVFAVTSPAESWQDFQAAGPVFWFFDYPKAPEHD